VDGDGSPEQSRTGRRWIIAVLALLVLAAAAVFAAVWATRSDSSSTSGEAAMTQGATEHMGTADETTGAIAILDAIGEANGHSDAKDLIPPDSCRPSSESSVTCTSPANAPALYSAIDSVSFRTFASRRKLYNAYRALAQELTQGPLRLNTGNCTPRSSNGEVSWNHNFHHPKIYSIEQLESEDWDLNKAAGRVFCTVTTDGEFNIVWTTNAGEILGHLLGNPHEDAWGWWRHIHHNLEISGSHHM
jgi:hypothetical protein